MRILISCVIPLLIFSVSMILIYGGFNCHKLKRDPEQYYYIIIILQTMYD